ncbi:MAG: Hsp20/alpha crystallin family protein [Chitinophagaceae bacterium]|nr:Hsp20/alpha crystallin family protein [Chitinophagaceae bacterium]
MTIVKHKPLFMNNLLDDFFNTLPVTENWNKLTTAVNIHETKEGYHLEMNAAGRKKEDFKIELEKGLLTISYDKKDEKETSNYKTLKREFSFESFKRSFTVDNNIDAEKIEAKYENGILLIFLPKKEEVKVFPKQITVS